MNKMTKVGSVVAASLTILIMCTIFGVIIRDVFAIPRVSMIFDFIVGEGTLTTCVGIVAVINEMFYKGGKSEK